MMVEENLQGQCPPGLLMELMSLRQLPEVLQQRVEAHVCQCQKCTHALEKIGLEREEFLEKHSFSRTINLPDRVRRWRVHPLPVPLIPAIVTTMVLCAVIGISFHQVFKQNSEPDSYSGVKGTIVPAIVMYLTRDHETSIAQSGVYRPYDRLQFAVYAEIPYYYYVASVNERGEVSIFYPASKQEQLKISTSQKYFLPFSITLDEYMGFERLFIIAADEVLSLPYLEKTLHDHVKRYGIHDSRDIGMQGVHQQSYLIKKVK